MKDKMSAKRITLIISVAYFIIGNIVGYGIYSDKFSDEGIIPWVFFPYTLPWGLSSLAGADWLTFVFVLCAFFITTILFFPLGKLLERKDISR